MAGHNCSTGFLLIEAIMAIFVLAIFSMVLGGYWHHISSQWAQGAHCLQALMVATDLIDQCNAGHLSWQAVPSTVGLFSIKLDKNPVTITSSKIGFNKGCSLITLTLSKQETSQSFKTQFYALAPEVY